MYVLKEPMQEWYEDILENHYEEAESKVQELLGATEVNLNGCYETKTAKPKKVRFYGKKDRAYRFIYSIFNRQAVPRDQVIRHACHNRRCINPGHLGIGSRRDNLQDEYERRANGVDFRLLGA